MSDREVDEEEGREDKGKEGAAADKGGETMGAQQSRRVTKKYCI
jgi:hypothetical protein